MKQQLSSVEKEREELVELMQNERKNTEELEQQEAKYGEITVWELGDTTTAVKRIVRD